MKLSPDKTEALLVGSSSILGTGCTYRLAGIVLTLKPPLCSLGVLLDQSLLLQEHNAVMVWGMYC